MAAPASRALGCAMWFSVCTSVPDPSQAWLSPVERHASEGVLAEWHRDHVCYDMRRTAGNAQYGALLQDGGFLRHTSCLKTVDRAHAWYMVSAQWPLISTAWLHDYGRCVWLPCH